MQIDSHSLSLLANCTEDVAAVWLNPFLGACEPAGITTPLRMAAFFAHLGVNSAGFINLDLSEGSQYGARGPARIQGLSNYAGLAKFSGFDCTGTPSMVLNPTLGALSATYLWTSVAMNEKIDRNDYAAHLELAKLFNEDAGSIEDVLRVVNKNKIFLGLPLI